MTRRRPAVIALSLTLAAGACSTAPISTPAPPVATSSMAVAASSAPAASVPAAPAGPVVDLVATLFPEAARRVPAVEACARLADAKDRAACLFSVRFEGDPAAKAIAVEMFERWGDVAGLEVEQDMDGGFRGAIHLVPELPVGPHRRHLGWVRDALADFDGFFKAARGAGAAHYRVAPIALRFFRSVGRTTPSAYAQGWSVSYNVSGSLFGGYEGVRETLFHEIFHLNDADHGDWSARALQEIFDAIVARCGTRVACLKPYAPGDTMVRGGTYYAFQPNNGASVHEYAAELATRWYDEQRAVLGGKKASRAAFKCGPPENERAWRLIVDEFFGGADLVPACR